MKIMISTISQIGPTEYEIKLRENLKIDDGYEGCLNFREETIYIDKVLPADRRMVVLLHEIIHQIDSVYECNLDESTISRLASGWAEFFKNNLNLSFDWTNIMEVQNEGDKYGTIRERKDCTLQ